jgi:hypothetical protein
LDNCMKHGQISKTILRKQQKKHSNAKTSLDGTNSYTDSRPPRRIPQAI